MNNHQLNCENISNLLPALCFNELATEQANEIHDHLADCDQCMEEYLALAMALQKSKSALDESELVLRDEQRSEIRKRAWAAELKIENQSLASNEKISVGAKAKVAHKVVQSVEVEKEKKRSVSLTALVAILAIGFVLASMLLPTLGTSRKSYNANIEITQQTEEVIEEPPAVKSDSQLHARRAKLKKSSYILPPPPPPPPPPPEEPDMETEVDTVNPEIAESIAVADIATEVEEVSDESPAAEILNDVGLSSDVKPSTSPMQSSKMYSSRSKKVKSMPLKKYGSEHHQGDEDVDIFTSGAAELPVSQLKAMKEKLEEYQVKAEELGLNLEEANGEINELKNSVGRKDTEIARINRQVELLTPDESVFDIDDGFAEDDAFSDEGFEEEATFDSDDAFGDQEFKVSGDLAFDQRSSKLVLNAPEIKKQKIASKKKHDNSQDIDMLITSNGLIQEEEEQQSVLVQRDLSLIKSNDSNLPSVSLPSPLFFEGMTDTQVTNLSTFAIDVDTASYTAARAEIRAGRKVDASNVRIEEFINSFDYHYSLPKDEMFNIDCELTDHKVYGGVKVLRVGIQGQRVGADSKKPGSYTFVIDNSGSMAAENRLPLIQKTLPKMFKAMNKNDEVTILTCEKEVRRLVNKLPAKNYGDLEAVVQNIEAGAVANLSKGIEEAYKLAAQNFRSGAVNRVVLLSDGIASLGEQEAEQVLKTVSEYRKQGIGNTVIGVGSEDFDDSFLETLANKGDGAYYFGDSKEEMNEILVNNFDASFKTIARDVKIQLDFDPQAVRSYRLLGYEKRRLANKDFRNDKVDAGEVGAGQSVTALYELVLHDKKVSAQLAKVNLRYKNLENELVTEINRQVKISQNQAFSQSQSSTRLAWCAATFARLLKNNGRGEVRFDQLAAEVDRIGLERPQDKKIQELKDLIIRCQSLY